MGNLSTLLTLVAQSGSLEGAWQEAGYASREAAAGALLEHAAGLSAAPKRSRAEAKPARKNALLVYVDGASRGNPGPAAVGVAVFTADGDELYARGKRIGQATNNVAEYRAVLEGLAVARELNATSVSLRVDSELVYLQLTGKYRIRHPDLKTLSEEVGRAARAFERFEIRQVPREENREADRAANEALNSPL